MVLFQSLEPPEVPKLYFFSLKKLVYLLLMYFWVLAVVSLHSCSEKGLLFLVMCTGFSLQWRLLLQSTDSTLLLALQLQRPQKLRLTGYLLHWRVGSFFFQTRVEHVCPLHCR